MKDLLDMFYIQGGHHEIVLFAITIDPRQPIRMSLSHDGEQAAAVAVHEILAELTAASLLADRAHRVVPNAQLTR
jgi:hypothetical protein